MGLLDPKQRQVVQGNSYNLIEMQRAIAQLRPDFVFAGFYGTDDDEDPIAFGIEKYGRVGAMPNGQYATIWDDANGTNKKYPLRSTGIAMDISSTAGNLQDVKLWYIDSNGDRQRTTVTLSGATPVRVKDSGGVVDADIMFPYRCRVINGPALTGDISLIGTDAVTYLKVLNGDEEAMSTQMACYYIPRGYVGIALKIGASSSLGKSIKLQYRLKLKGQPDFVAKPVELAEGIFIESLVDHPFVFPEETFISVRGLSSATGTSCSAWFNAVMVKKVYWDELIRTVRDN